MRKVFIKRKLIIYKIWFNKYGIFAATENLIVRECSVDSEFSINWRKCNLESNVPFAAGRRKLFSLHSCSGKHISRRANCWTSSRAHGCYLHTRYLSAGNRGRNFVSMGIVWQQVGKISTHRLPAAVPVPGHPARPRCTVTQFRFRRPSSCFPMPSTLASSEFAIPARNTLALGNRWWPAKQCPRRSDAASGIERLVRASKRENDEDRSFFLFDGISNYDTTDYFNPTNFIFNFINFNSFNKLLFPHRNT